MAKSTLRTIKDVIFVYTSVSRPQKQLNKDNKPALSDNPLEFHSWEIKILISESRFKKMKKAHAGAKNLPNAKDVDIADAKKRFGVDVDEDQILIKFSQGCLFGKKGDRKDARPVRQIGIRGGVQDRNGQTVSQDTSIANGTLGHLQYNPVENGHGLYLYPVAICITDLIEYVPEGGMDEDGFGMEELPEGEEDAFGTEPESEGTEDPSDDFDDDDVPF